LLEFSLSEYLTDVTLSRLTWMPGLYKAIKQGPEKSDIVGEGWQSHQGTSWEMGVFPKREPDLPTMSSLSAFVHTSQLHRSTCIYVCRKAMCK